MAKANVQQYPHIRTLTWCPACGNDKRVGLVLCWPCNNGFKELFDGTYGPTLPLQLDKIERGEYTPR